MEITTVRLHKPTKSGLDRYKEYRNESYDEVVMKLVGIADNLKSKPELSKEAVDRIEAARKRIKNNGFITETEARKRLAL